MIYVIKNKILVLIFLISCVHFKPGVANPQTLELKSVGR